MSVIQFKKKLPQIISKEHSNDLMFIKFINLIGKTPYDENSLEEIIDSDQYIMIYKNKCAIVFSNHDNIKDSRNSNPISDNRILAMVDNSVGQTSLDTLNDITDYYNKHKGTLGFTGEVISISALD